jgi:3-mercaptopyruvate sulfurtransferase SseA
MKKRKTTRFPIVFLVASGFLLMLAAAIFVMQNEPNPDVSQPSAAVSDLEEQAYPEIQRVSLESAKAALDANTAVVVDVRDAGSYAASHVPGALSIPLSDLEDHLGELDSTDWIITYCT